VLPPTKLALRGVSPGYLMMRTKKTSPQKRFDLRNICTWEFPKCSIATLVTYLPTTQPCGLTLALTADSFGEQS
jgi:hypothetical protein